MSHQLGTGAALTLLVILTIAPMALLVLRGGRAQIAPDKERRGNALMQATLALDFENRLARKAEQLEHASTERSKIEAAMYRTQRVEAIGQLTGGIARDFNNLLTGISGSLELLPVRVAKGQVGELDRCLNAAQGAARRAAARTHRLLAFSRRQTLDPQRTEVNRLIAELEDLIRRTVGSTIEIDVIGSAGLWPALVDQNQLENALLNLCINGRDAMPKGGRLTIETANKWRDDRAARERDLPPGQYLAVCVTDNGSGMAPEIRQRAFDPLFTTKPAGSGTGLGVSMVYGFARQSGGPVRIYCEIDQGSTICIYLPRHLSDSSTERLSPEAQALSVDAPDREQMVLVVDDEPTVRLLVDRGAGDDGLRDHRGARRRHRAEEAPVEHPSRPADHRRRPARRHQRAAGGRCRADRAEKPEGAVHHPLCRECGRGQRLSRTRRAGADQAVRDGSPEPARPRDAGRPGVAGMRPPLCGQRVLIVEDEEMVAELIGELVIDEGGVVVDPATGVDVNLAGVRSFLVADVPLGRGIPCLFATGCGDDAVAPAHVDAPVIGKPFRPDVLVRRIEQLIA